MSIERELFRERIDPRIQAATGMGAFVLGGMVAFIGVVTEASSTIWSQASTSEATLHLSESITISSKALLIGGATVAATGISAWISGVRDWQ